MYQKLLPNQFFRKAAVLHSSLYKTNYDVVVRPSVFPHNGSHSMTELTIDQTLQRGIKAHKAGQIQEADRLYTAILITQPKHPATNHNMGVLAVSVGKLNQALPFFKRALVAQPSTAQFWLSYIDALIRLDRLAEAKAVLGQARSKGAKGVGFDKLEQSLKLSNNAPIEPVFNSQSLEQVQPNILDSFTLDQAIKLAKSKAAVGGVKEAKRIYQDVLDKFPQNKRARDGISVQVGKSVDKVSKVKNPSQDQLQSLLNLRGQGQFHQALKQAKTLMQKFPKSPMLHNLNGVLYNDLGQLDKSVEAYEKVLAIKPNIAEVYNNLGKVFKEQGKLEKAIKAYKQALIIEPNIAEIYNNLGNALGAQGMSEEAIEAYNNALTIKPEYARAYHSMGVILQDHGQLEKAIKAYNNALTVKSDYAEAHRSLSLLTKYTPSDPIINKVQDLLQRPNLNDQDRSSLHYTYAKIKEDLGDLKGAFDSFVAGGVLRKKVLGYDFSHDKKLFEDIKEASLQMNDLSITVSDELTSHIPLFILGMPRSGTTLVEQIVSSHTEVTGAGELNYIAQFGAKLAVGLEALNADTVLEFRERYLTELAKRSPNNKLVTDKMPLNFRFIGLICAAFPEANIIHVTRNAEATCWSNFKHYFISKDLGYSYTLSDTLKYYDLYKDLMHFWHKSYCDRIYNIDYDKLTENYEVNIRRLLEYLGLNWEDACLAPQNNKRSVRTASQQQVRQKIYTGSSQAWRKYEPFLANVFDKI